MDKPEITIKDVYLAALLVISDCEIQELRLEGTPPLGVFVFERTVQASLVIAKYHAGAAMTISVQRLASVVRELHQALKIRKAS